MEKNTVKTGKKPSEKKQQKRDKRPRPGWRKDASRPRRDADTFDETDFEEMTWS